MATGVSLHGVDGGTTEIDASEYAFDAVSKPARLILNRLRGSVSLRRLNGIEIACTADFGAAAEDVPAPIRQALLLLVAHWFERREPIAAVIEPPEVSAMVAGLLAPYRQVRL